MTSGMAVPLHVTRTGRSTPSDIACNGCTTAELDLYLSQSTGNDANDGLTEGTAVATPERIDELIPATVDHAVRVHCTAARYVLTRPYIFRQRERRSGYIRVLADEVWDPTVFVVELEDVAAAGTDEFQCVTAGLVADAHRGQWLRFTDGDAAGQWRTIQGNTTTDIVPDDTFGLFSGLVPAPGDTFQVCTPGVVFEIPTDTFSALQAGTAGAEFWLGDGSTNGAAPLWQWEGVGFDAANLAIGSMNSLIGVISEQAFNRVSGMVFAGATWAAVGPYYESDAGYQWGLTCQNLNGEGGASCFLGTLVAINAQCPGSWTGGHIDLLRVGLHTGSDSAPPQFEIAYWPFITQTIGQVIVDNSGVLHMGWAAFVAGNAAALLTVRNSATCHIDHAAEVTGESTGANTVLCARNGSVFMDESPALGKAVGNDWNCDGGVVCNKADFIPNFAQLFRTSVQERA